LAVAHFSSSPASAGGDEKCVEILIGTHERKRPFVRSMHWMSLKLILNNNE